MSERDRRLAIFETNYGRAADWWIELDGRRLGRLTDGKFDDMFWYVYRVDLASSDDEARALVLAPDLWARCRLTFRSVPFGILAESAFGGVRGPQQGRIALRGLCIDISEPSLFERVLLWWRRRRCSIAKTTLEAPP